MPSWRLFWPEISKGKNVQHSRKNPGGSEDVLVKLQARVHKDSAEYIRKLAFYREAKKQSLINEIIQDYMARNPLPQ